MKFLNRCILVAACLLSLMLPVLRAQVSNERLLRTADEPHNWLMYSGTYASQRYSTLRQINPANVKTLEQKWVFQAESLEKFETISVQFPLSGENSCSQHHLARATGGIDRDG